ncbi:MAG: hypothetical protein M3N97_09130 [Pseudomonadota bacterium]|nr:hypothetical protein [Pseudomonadota bacterium]
MLVEEGVNFRDRPVEHRDLVAVIVHVEHEVLAHHRQANQTDVAGVVCHMLLLWTRSPAAAELRRRPMRIGAPFYFRVDAIQSVQSEGATNTARVPRSGYPTELGVPVIDSDEAVRVIEPRHPGLAVLVG